MADTWQDVLLAIWRKALQRTLEFAQKLDVIVWAIADRRAKDLIRMRKRRRFLKAEEKSTCADELGRRWQMLTGLQQEEVRELIWTRIQRLPASQKAVWHTYLQYIEDHARLPTAGQLTEILSQTSGDIVTNESPDLVLQIGRKQTCASLRSNGYDIFRPSEAKTGEVCGEDISSPVDRLFSEAFLQLLPDNNYPVTDLPAASFLTENDRNTLEELPPDLATRTQSKYRTLRTWCSPLWSDRLAERDTYLPTQTVRVARNKTGQSIDALVSAYNMLLHEKRLDWAPRYHFVALLGEGGQGVVYLVRCPGVDGFNRPLALKIFAPDRYTCPSNYVTDVRRMARMASIVANIHHPNLLDVVDFQQQHGVRMMLMEWIDGHDLGRLMVAAMMERLRERATPENWGDLSEVVVREGPNQPRLRPFIAVAIVKSCLAALARMHDRGIVHGDIKPSNIMLTRDGYVKLIDIGSTFVWKESPVPYHCTYRYAAPEVLQGGAYTPQSDLASLGYVLVELLSGHALFADLDHGRQLLDAKTSLPRRLADLLPELRKTREEARRVVSAACRTGSRGTLCSRP